MKFLLRLLRVLCWLQVEARAYEIWGGEEGLEDEHARKSDAREKKRQNQYAKEIKGVCVCKLSEFLYRL